MSVSSCVRGKPLAVLFAALLAGMAATAAAQEAGVYGRVTDPGGDALPGATVTVTNAETGLQRTVTSGGDGLYQVPSLPVGTYSVMASLDGFQTVTNEGLRLQVSQQVTLNISLELAGVEEAVTVTASAPPSSSPARRTSPPSSPRSRWRSCRCRAGSGSISRP